MSSLSIEEQATRLEDIDRIPLGAKSSVALFSRLISLPDTSKKGKKASIEYWVRTLLTLVSKGFDYYRLVRPATIIAHIEDDIQPPRQKPKKKAKDVGSNDDPGFGISLFQRNDTLSFFGFGSKKEDDKVVQREYIERLGIIVEDDIILVDNMFTAPILRQILPLFDTVQFTLENILFCFSTGNFNQILNESHWKESSWAKYIEIFLLLILYITMLQAKDPMKHKVYKTLLQYKKNSTSYWGYFGHRKFRLVQFIDAILQRKVRFHLVEKQEMVSNHQSEYTTQSPTVTSDEDVQVEEITKYGHENIVYNEFFECHELDWITRKRMFTEATLARRKRTLTEKDLDNQKAVQDEIAQQEICFERLIFYTGKSKYIILAHLRYLTLHKSQIYKSFRKENMNVLIQIIEMHAKKLTHEKDDSELNINSIVVDYCLQLFTTGLQNSLDPNFEIPPWFLRLADKATRIILTLVNDDSTSKMAPRTLSVLFPNCILFLGAAYGMCDEDTCHTIHQLFIHKMQLFPQYFVLNENRFGIIMTGISYLLIGVDNHLMKQTVNTVLHLWDVFAKPDPKNQIAGVSLIEHGLIVMKLFQFVGMSKFDKSGVNEWLHLLAEECAAVLGQDTNSQPSRMMSLFAITGLMTAVQDIEEANPGVMERDQMVEDSAILLVDTVKLAVYFFDNNILPARNDTVPNALVTDSTWRQAIAISCANVKVIYSTATPQTPKITNYMMNTLLENIVGIDYVFEDLKCGYTDTVNKITQHKRSKLFNLQAVRFVAALSQLFMLEISDTASNTPSAMLTQKYRENMLKRIESYCKKLHNDWRTTNLVWDQTNDTKQKEELSNALTGIVQTMFVCITLFIRNVVDYIQDSDIVAVMNIFSYIYFCKVDHPTYHSLLRLLLARLLIPVQFPSLSTGTTEKQSQQYAMAIFHLIPASSFYASENDKKRNRYLNDFSHFLFASIFAKDYSYRAKLVPSYIRLSLENYPKLTRTDSFRRGMSSLCKNLDNDSDMVLFALKSVEQKVISLVEVANSYLHEKESSFNNTNGTNKLPKRTPKEISAKHNQVTLQLAQCFFSQITSVNLQLLDSFLLMCEDALLSIQNQEMQKMLCKHLYATIANNFDYTRKMKCVKWYLDLLELLNLMEDDAVPSDFAGQAVVPRERPAMIAAL